MEAWRASIRSIAAEGYLRVLNASAISSSAAAAHRAGPDDGIKDNLAWCTRYQAYLREQPALIVWVATCPYPPSPTGGTGPAELQLIDGRHWLLETHLQQVVPLIRDFLGCVHAGPGTA